MKRLFVYCFFVALLVACTIDESKRNESSFALSQTIRHTFIDRVLSKHNIEELDNSKNIAFAPLPQKDGLMACEIFAEDISIGQDSFRIGIIHPIEEHKINAELKSLEDWLILVPYGQDSMSFFKGLPNLGIVTTSTVFRIDRNFYTLTRLDDTRQQIGIHKLNRRPSSPATAELDTRLRKISLQTITGQDTVVQHTKDKQMLLYFFSLKDQGDDFLALKTALDQQGEDAAVFVPINSTDSQEDLSAFSAKHNIDTPIYRTTANSCSGLLCDAVQPYAILVNEAGRIYNYHMPQDNLLKLIQDRTK